MWTLALRTPPARSAERFHERVGPRAGGPHDVGARSICGGGRQSARSAPGRRERGRPSEGVLAPRGRLAPRESVLARRHPRHGLSGPTGVFVLVALAKRPHDALGARDRRALHAELFGLGGELTLHVLAGLSELHERRLELGEPVEICGPGVLAFDGDRARRLAPGQSAVVRVARDGPWVIDVETALRRAADRGLFFDRQDWKDSLISFWGR